MTLPIAGQIAMQQGVQGSGDAAGGAGQTSQQQKRAAQPSQTVETAQHDQGKKQAQVLFQTITAGS